VSIFETVRGVISENLDVPVESVRSDSKASDFSAWDSVQHLVLVMDVEQKFDCKFSLEEIAEMNSVERIVKAVEKRAKA
jgi:acyl carrier protein